MIEQKVQQFCIKGSVGLKYWPDTPTMSKGTTETFMRNLGVHSAYTCEVRMYESINKRTETQENYIKFFMETVKAYE
jgi:hypothetical protein